MQENTSKMIMAAVLVAILGVAGFAIFGSSDSDDSDDSVASTALIQEAKDLPLNLQLNNLAPLSEGIYEGWVVQGDDKLSFGTFNTNEQGEVVGNLDIGDIDAKNGDTVAISIEPVPDTDPEPSATIVLAGEITDGKASLAFPVDVSGFAGKYVLATPSNGDDTNETSGVWFISLETGAPTVGLDIPVAPAGWTYEGWVVHNGAPISTGQFTDPATIDSFDGFTGPEGVPPFPGEDFVVNLPDGVDPYELADGSSKVVLSLEPLQEGTDPTGPAPAQVKPLVADIAEGAEDHKTFDLGVDTSSLPTGSASL